MKIAFLAFELLLLVFFIVGVRTQEDEDQWEFTYSEGPRGPENWGKLKEEWKQCGEGRQQSPIVVVDNCAEVRPNFETFRHYNPANATLENRGHDIMLKWTADAGTIQIQGKRYTLQQCHWHHPSEHALDGKRYPLEIHLVHQSNDGAIAVVGVLYDYPFTPSDREPEPFLAKLTQHLQSIANKEPPVEDVGTVDPWEIDVSSSKYYRYAGSLTTPPCTEGVVWTIVGTVKNVLPEQVKLLLDAVHDDFRMNARPLQALNGRIVEMFKVSPSPRITDFTPLVDVA